MLLTLVSQMGSLGERSVLELEDESLVSSGSIDRKVHPIDVSPHKSFSIAGSEDSGWKYTRISMLNSIKVVFFADKINLLIPCGFLAVLVDKLTGHHVSCVYLYVNTSFRS